jgi:hypothetical protein
VLLGWGADIASALVRIVTAIVRDEHAVLTVSTRAPHEMQLGDVWLTLPAVIAREGVVRVLPLPTDAAEAAALRGSAAVLRCHIESAATNEMKWETFECDSSPAGIRACSLSLDFTVYGIFRSLWICTCGTRSPW